jgi:type I restriction enzyme S subunit
MAPTYTDQISDVRAINQKCVRGGRVRTKMSRAHDPAVPVRPDAILRQGDICINSTGTGTIGRVGLWSDNLPGTFFADTHVTVVRPVATLVSSKFLAESFSSAEVQRLMEGTCFFGSTHQVELDKSSLLSLDLLIPPLGEQQKIAVILSSLDNAIESTQTVIEQLEVVKRALLAELLTRGIPEQHGRFRLTGIGLVPEDWRIGPLSDIVEAIDSGWSPRCESMPAAPDEWGILKVSAVSWGEFRPNENKRLPDRLAPRPELEVKFGDVLVSRANTPELVGRAVLVESTRPRLMLSDKLLRLRPRVAVATNAFLQLVLSAETTRAQMAEAATGSSRSMKNISQTKLNGVLVAVPSRKEQEQITEMISRARARERAERDYLASLVWLKSSLLSTLLSGDVRVIPNEGPS